jgi:hypothetical protein
VGGGQSGGGAATGWPCLGELPLAAQLLLCCARLGGGGATSRALLPGGAARRGSSSPAGGVAPGARGGAPPLPWAARIRDALAVRDRPVSCSLVGGGSWTRRPAGLQGLAGADVVERGVRFDFGGSWDLGGEQRAGG